MGKFTQVILLEMVLYWGINCSDKNSISRNFLNLKTWAESSCRTATLNLFIFDFI